MGLGNWIFWFFWYWLATKRSSVMTVISNSAKKELQNHLRRKQFNIEVVPNCVSAEFQPHERDFQETRPTILQVGTKANKNIERVAQALDSISCRPVIIGQVSNTQRAVLAAHNVEFRNESKLGYVLSLIEVDRNTWLRLDLMLIVHHVRADSLVLAKSVVKMNIGKITTFGGEAAHAIQARFGDSE